MLIKEETDVSVCEVVGGKFVLKNSFYELEEYYAFAVSWGWKNRCGRLGVAQINFLVKLWRNIFEFLQGEN